ncbi:MAG: hypothetical protein JJD96_08115 [Thermoleophilia bacterium]|nr:hypothetical protein [Thermoleophilia bacterium]
MKIRLLISIFFVVILAAAISACDDSGTTTYTKVSTSDVPDPCTLFTKADAEAILGEPVGESTSGEAEGTKSCSYMTTAAGARIANVIVIKPCSMMDYADYAASPSAEPVEGIGMHASWNKATLLVHSRSGDTCIYTSGGGNPPGTDPLDDKPALEQAKKVANKVLERLEP